jgi:hypothetical protein
VAERPSAEVRFQKSESRNRIDRTIANSYGSEQESTCRRHTLMRRIQARHLLLVLLSLPVGSVLGQNWGSVSGTVSDTTGRPVYGVTVIVDATNFGTSTGEDGSYSLRMPAGSYTLQFSSVGFRTQRRPVTVVRDGMARVDAVMRESALEMDVITVEGDRPEVAAGVFQIDPQSVQDIPSPLRDPLRALKLMPGVASNNELSNQPVFGSRRRIQREPAFSRGIRDLHAVPTPAG